MSSLPPPPTSSSPPYGSSCLPLFLLSPGYLNLNHGSFGTVGRKVLERQREYTDEQEGRPDVWFRDTYLVRTKGRGGGIVQDGVEVV
jgi:hypothetical protein